MDERAGSSHGARSAVHNPGRGDKSPSLDDGSEEGQSSVKYRRIDQEGAKTLTASDNASRFMFVDSSSTGSRRRSDQRAINAHIQQTAHRNRKQASQKQRPLGAANIGRNRRAPVLQPRPIEAQRAASSQSTLDAPSSPSFVSSPTSSSTVSIRSERRTPEPEAPVAPRYSPDVHREQLERLRHYSSARRLEVDDAVKAHRDEQIASTDVDGVRRASPDDEASSVRSMLTQILQRLDAGHAGHSIRSPPNTSLRNTALDPFNISSVHLTSSMNTALRHCEYTPFPLSLFLCTIPLVYAPAGRIGLGIQTRRSPIVPNTKAWELSPGAPYALDVYPGQRAS